MGWRFSVRFIITGLALKGLNNLSGCFLYVTYFFDGLSLYHTTVSSSAHVFLPWV